MESSPKISKSIFIVGLEKVSMIIIQLLTSVILARLLTPSDYGTIAMISIFISLSSALAEAGLGGSLIYYKDVDERDFSTVFWLNTATSILLYLVVCMIAKPVSLFYGHPDLVWIMAVSGLSIVFSALGTIQLTLMYKQLCFRKLAFVSIISYVVSAIVAIILAYYGFGVWALVAQQVLVSVVRAILLTLSNKYMPKLYFSMTLVLKHWNFGKGLLFSTLLKTVYDNMYLQLIGKYCSIVNAGYYNQAKKLKDIPSNLFCNVFETALFPIFSKYTDEAIMIDKARKVTSFFAMIVCPVFFLCVLFSKEIVLVLLGSKWHSCAWILSYMSIGAVFFVFETINRSIMKANGLSNLLFKVDFFKRSISLIIMFVAIIMFELKGIVFSFVVNCILGWTVNTYALSKKSTYSFKIQLYDLLHYLSLSVLSTFAVYCMNLYFAPSNTFICIVLDFIVFCFLYFGVLMFLKDKSIRVLYNVVCKKNNLKKSF